MSLYSEKELLLKEVHHRIKNNLQLTISMLNLFANECDDSLIVDFVDSVNRRFLIMMEIHQHLYSLDCEAKINIQNYLEVLVDKISLSLMYREIQIEINAHNIYLDSNSTMSIGMIVNELMTNSLKHAFFDKKNNKISISICEVKNERFIFKYSDGGVVALKSDNFIRFGGLKLLNLLMMQLNDDISFDINNYSFQAN